MSNKISEVFDVQTTPIAPLPDAPNVPGAVHDDADYARSNLRQLIATSQNALEYALELAKQSESPRAFEVLATMINTASDLNTKLIDIHQKEQRMVVGEKPAVPQNVTNNVVFSGTTSELNDMIAKRMLQNETKPD